MELVVLSGKGGTGKTTIATAIAELSENVVKVDCDVDAPNLYLFYEGENIETDSFYGNKVAVIDKDLCNQCGKCEEYCRFHAINDNKISSFHCEGCGACTLVCPQKAIKLQEQKGADVFITRTHKGIISRAQMEIGSDGSGKLITELRKKAKKHVKDDTLTIIDGSPGIGCAVISSVTGSNIALIVTEPTKSGLQDLIRVAELCTHFGVTILVCINKYNLNEEISKEIEELCCKNNIKVVGKIPYDDTVMKSINELKPIIYYDESPANKAVRVMWGNINKIIKFRRVIL